MGRLRPYLDLKDGEVCFFSTTLESEYLAGLYGAVPYISDLEGARVTFHRTPATLEEPKVLAARLRELADELEGKEKSNE